MDEVGIELVGKEPDRVLDRPLEVEEDGLGRRVDEDDRWVLLLDQRGAFARVWGVNQRQAGRVGDMSGEGQVALQRRYKQQRFSQGVSPNGPGS